jgi:hypothetical protein
MNLISRPWPILNWRDRRERDFDADMRIAISDARFNSVSQEWRIATRVIRRMR